MDYINQFELILTKWASGFRRFLSEQWVVRGSNNTSTRGQGTNTWISSMITSAATRQGGKKNNGKLITSDKKSAQDVFKLRRGSRYLKYRFKVTLVNDESHLVEMYVMPRSP